MAIVDISFSQLSISVFFNLLAVRIFVFGDNVYKYIE